MSGQGMEEFAVSVLRTPALFVLHAIFVAPLVGTLVAMATSQRLSVGVALAWAGMIFGFAVVVFADLPSGSLGDSSGSWKGDAVFPLLTECLATAYLLLGAFPSQSSRQNQNRGRLESNLDWLYDEEESSASN